jgi:nucleoside-diphosphate-sugar epimerase
MSTVLVTGGTGFLGRRIVERLLADGRSVAVLARRPAPDLEKRGVRFICAELDNTTAVSASCAGIETVFHVAAKVGVWGRYVDFFRTNVLGTRALLEGSRLHGVRNFIYTSTPSVVYNGRDLAGVNESLPLTTRCPSPYPLTKAIAEREVLAANSPSLRTVALRPHLIWGVGDPHLVPRILERARAGRLRIVGHGKNHVDMVHVENAVDAHLLAEAALDHPMAAASAETVCNVIRYKPSVTDKAATSPGSAAGKAYFITNDEPVVLWDWVNQLLVALGERPIRKRISLGAASTAGALCEAIWRFLPIKGEPPMTRFVAAELAHAHWFDISAAKHDLGYQPRISMSEGTDRLISHLKAPGS